MGRAHTAVVYMWLLVYYSSPVFLGGRLYLFVAMEEMLVWLDSLGVRLRNRIVLLLFLEDGFVDLCLML